MAPSSFVNDTVNVIEGNFYLTMPHLRVPGHVPLDLVQYYNSQSRYTSWLGVGMSLNYAFAMMGSEDSEKTHDKYGKYALLACEVPGGSIIRCIGKPEFDSTNDFYIDPDVIHAGLTNCGSGEISARHNLKNIRLKEKMKHNEYADWTCYLPDGSVREHYRAYDHNSAMNVKSEKRLNKTELEFDYYKRHSLDGVIKGITAKGKHILNWLHFSDDEHSRQVSVTSSNGKKATFYFFSKGDHYYIDEIETSDNPKMKFDYTHAGEYYCIDRVSWPEGRFLELKYDHKGRVETQKAPVGKEGTTHTIWTFSYHTDFTSVYDAYDRKKIYNHKHGRITSIEDDLNTHFYRAKAFYWGEKEGHSWGKLPKTDEGNLLGYSVLNHEHCGELLCHYKYDDYGNIVKETLYGNLSGAYPYPFWIASDGHPQDDNVERYHKYYTYSRDHLLTHQSEDDGPSIEYRYKSDTDLVWGKFVTDGKKIILREFYEYDDDGILTEKIVDDGTTDNKSFLGGVTERFITKIEPVRGQEGSGQGLPQEIREYYVDLATERKVLLKRTWYNYNKASQVTEEAIFDADDAYRYSTFYEYDSHGRLRKKWDRQGQETHYNYDSNNNKTYEKLVGAGFYTKFDYDKANRLIAITEHHDDGTKVELSYTYDYMGNRTASTDRYGHTTLYTYDDCNRVSAITLPGGEYMIKKEYDIFDNVTKEILPNGAATSYEYTIRKKPSRITYDDGTYERFEYNFNGTLAAKWDRSGTKTAYSYDVLGRVVKTALFDPAGNELSRVTHAYNSFHLLSTTDAMGHTTYYRYDGAGRKVEEWQEDQSNYSKITFHYDMLGRLICTRAYYGKEIKNCIATYYEYDSLDRVFSDKRVDMIGTCISWNFYEYDRLGNRTLKRSGHADEDAEIKTTFNSQSELVDEIDECGRCTTHTHNHSFVNELGQKVLQKTMRDALHNTTEEYYDILGRCISILRKNVNQELIHSTALSYNSTGKKTKQLESVYIDGQKDHDYTILWEYDTLDRVTKLIELPEEKTTLYQYDASGRLSILTKPDGVVLDHTYDALGRLLSLRSSDRTIAYTYVYDLHNNPIEITDEVTGHVTKRSYDLWNRVTKDGSMHYEYDALGRLTRLTAPDDSSVEYCYLHSHLHSVARYKNDTKLYEHRYLKFDLRGRVLESELISNLGKAAFAWDKKGHNTHITTDYYTLEIPKEGFDPVGNLIAYAFKDVVGSVSCSASYNDLYQLIEEEGVAHHAYKNDSLHNRLARDEDCYTVDASNKLLSNTARTFTYDKNGNIIEEVVGGKTISYQYDALDRLIRVDDTTYLYDSFHRRIARIQGDEVTYFLHLDRREIGLFDPTTGQLREFRVLGQGKGAELGASIAIELNNKVYCPLHDHRGSIICLINPETSQVQETYRYTAFGECEIYDEALQPIQKSSLHNPWRYASKRYDEETGFVYFSRRYLAPHLGRWITPDPIGFTDGPNLYAYLHNNPLTRFDLYGLFDDEELDKQCDMAAALFLKNLIAVYSHQLWDGTISLARHSGDFIQHPIDKTNAIIDTAGHVYTSLSTLDAQSIGNYASSIGSALADSLAQDPSMTMAEVIASFMPSPAQLTKGAAVNKISSAEKTGEAIQKAQKGGQIGVHAAAKASNESAPFIKTSSALSSKQGADLQRHLSYVEEYGERGIKFLQDGRVRYYGELASAKTPGIMEGRRYVHEFDPLTGRTRGWHETLDHEKKIRQVRPQQNDGKKRHYSFDAEGNYTGSW